MATIDYRHQSLLATLSSNGLMSAADKIKLDGLRSVTDGYATTAELQSEIDRSTLADQIIIQSLDGYGEPPNLDGYATTLYVDGYFATELRKFLGVKVVSGDTLLNLDTPINILNQSLLGYNLGINKIYNITLGIRVVIWSLANKANSGSMDTVVDGYFYTNNLGTINLTIQTTPLLDKSRMNAVINPSTFTVASITNGFSITVTRPTGLDCAARCNWTVVAFEDIT